jgi:CRP-like cAMP-binding protein
MGGSETTQTMYIVQVEGDALKIESEPLLRAFDENKSVRDVLLKYTQAMIAQISQNVACNRLHAIEQRYARWLLEVRDRVQTEDLRLTQEFVSQMLGVRRASVTTAAGEFEKRGLISIDRNLTRIRDSEGLERLSCDCYSILRDEYNRLLGDPLTEHR